MKKILIVLLMLSLIAGSLLFAEVRKLDDRASSISASMTKKSTIHTTSNHKENLGRNREVLFQQNVVGPDGDWTFATSDTGSDGPYSAADNFYGVEGTITGISFTGLDMVYDAGWNPGDEDPMTFDVIFYNDDGGNVGTEVASMSVEIAREATGILYADFYPSYTWTADLPESVQMSDGWISINGSSVAEPNCWFFWGNSLDGDGTAYQHDGSAWGAVAYDLAFTLTGTIASEDAPGAPTDLVVTPDDMGGLSVDLSWVNPSLTYNGDPLTDLDEIRVYRDGELIYTDNSPTIGGAGSYTDTVPAAGEYSYSIAGYNEYGEGPPVSSITYWIGPDVPGAVTDLLLENVSTRELAGQLTWTNPTEGMHGGYFDGITGYTIVRSDAEPFDIAGPVTTWTDDTIPASDYYSYTVTPYNASGEGMSAVSNTVLITDANIVFADDFSGGLENWDVVLNSGEGSWIVYDEPYPNSYNMPETSVPPVCSADSDEAGSGTTTDTDLILANPIDFSSFLEVILEFDSDFNALIADDACYVDVSNNNGASWTTVLEMIGEGVTASHEMIDISEYVAGYAQVLIKFHSVQPGWDWWWTIDNVMLSGVEGELGAIEGTVTDASSGSPIEGANVDLNGSITTTDANGDYEFPSVLPGTHTLICTADGYYEAQVEVEVESGGTAVADIQLDSNVFGSIEGTVTDADSGNPLAGAEITAMSEEGYEYSATTDGSGFYSIPEAVADNYDIMCFYPNYPVGMEYGVEVTDGAATVVDFSMQGYTYYSDFEANNGDLISSDPAAWQWGAPTNGPGAAYSGTNVWATVLDDNYANSTDATLDTPQSYLLTGMDAMLEFWHWYDIEPSWDGGNVKISTDEGASWEVIEPLTGYPGEANASNPLPEGEPIFTGHDQGSWEEVQFDLSAYVGESVMFRWHFGSDGSVQYPGWFIDNVSLSGGAPPTYGSIDGHVMEATNRDPIEGAMITFGTYSATTDAAGYYSLSNVMTGNYDVCCSAEGYVDEMEYGVQINEDETTTVDFEMTWAEIAVDPTSFDVQLDPDQTYNTTLAITNDGTADLTYNIAILETDRFGYDNADNLIDIEIPSLDNPVFESGTKVNPKIDYTDYSAETNFTVHKGLSYTRDRNISVLILAPDGDAATAMLETALNEFADLDVSVFPEAGFATISIDDLTPYDVVFAYNDLTWDNAGTTAATIGDLLADYIDAGGKVLDNMYLHSFDDWGLAGRYIDEQYAPFTMATLDNWSPTELGTVYLPGHPIMAGVTTVGQTWGVQDPGIAAGATQIADWDDGNPFVAVNDYAVGLNLLPIDPNAGPTWTGDMPTLLHNAIVWIGSPITWLSVSPTSGTVAAGTSEDIDLMFDSNNIEQDVYSANIVISHNGMDRDDVIVPVTFTVGPDFAEEIETPVFKTNLGINYPNPFNPVTQINFALAKTSEVEIKVYNAKGGKVKTLVSDKYDSGVHSVRWNGKDDNGKGVSSGVYFYKMKAGRYTSTKKMILMK